MDHSSQLYTLFTRSVESLKRTLEEYFNNLEQLNKTKQLEKSLKNSKTRKTLDQQCENVLASANQLHEKHEVLLNEPKQGSRESLGSSPGTPKGSDEKLTTPNRNYSTNNFFTNANNIPKPVTKTPSGAPRGKESTDWLFLNINRAQAETILLECNEGAFLVRSSSIQGCYALSRWKPGSNPEHYIIAPCAEGYLIQDCLDTNTYPTLNDLIASTFELNDYRPVGDVKRRISSPGKFNTESLGTQFQNMSINVEQPKAQPQVNIPPPPDSNWKEARAPDGRIYYYNIVTKKTSWTKPT